MNSVYVGRDVYGARSEVHGLPGECDAASLRHAGRRQVGRM